LGLNGQHLHVEGVQLRQARPHRRNIFAFTLETLNFLLQQNDVLSVPLDLLLGLGQLVDQRLHGPAPYS
jgi:hypothetical protein